MKCPVCGKKSQHIQCPDCGFDSSRDYEKYPTLAPVGKASAISALQKQWEQLEKTDKVIRKKRPWLALIACVAILVLGIGIGAGLGREKPVPTEHAENVQMQIPPEIAQQTVPLETTMQTTPLEATIETTPPETTEPIVQVTYQPGEEPWKDNILRSDEVPTDKNGYYSESIFVIHPVFGSEYRREQIASVTFLDTLTDAPEDAWDASEAGDGRVLAWVIPNGELYDLYIGAEGGISTGVSCRWLFAGYTNTEYFRNMDFLHTDKTLDMRSMFDSCRTIRSLDLLGFDTANVQNMSAMFHSCSNLTSLDLSSFDTSKVQNMNTMFYLCTSLTSINLSSFKTTNVKYMNSMFHGCSFLISLDLRSFDTSGVKEMKKMFYDCPAGDDWQHLLK